MNTRYFLEVKRLNGQHFVRIRELKRKFTSTSICTNTEGCPTSVSRGKEMILNGRIISASKSPGVR